MMNDFAVPWYKQIAVIVLFPVIVLLAIAEPTWNELWRAWVNNTWLINVKRNFHEIYVLYTQHLWNKK